MKSGIAIAMSGGGVRAASFHAGVLKWLAENGELSSISAISTVSGGSLLVGLVFHIGGYSWPSSEEYIKCVFPKIRAILTETSLQGSATRSLVLNPRNWRFLFSRACIISKTIESLWGIDAELNDLPVSPIWTINGTTAENGHRFRIKGTKLGDYGIGYADAPHFRLSDAMALSAALPIGIGPLQVTPSKYRWEKRESWTSDRLVVDYVLPFRRLHLYDGGVYDNLGIEPLFDVGAQEIKKQNGFVLDRLIVSDASSPISCQEIPSVLNLSRLKRLVHIMLDQVRSLRIRSFVNFLKMAPGSGAYYQLGSVPEEKIRKYGDLNAQKYVGTSLYEWLSPNEIRMASDYSTTLHQMKTFDFDLIAQHGYETSKWNNLLFGT